MLHGYGTESAEADEYEPTQENVIFNSKISYINPVPSQILTLFQENKIVHIDLDSGCWVSCAKLEFVKKMKWKILPNSQLAKLADDKTILKSVGEINRAVEVGVRVIVLDSLFEIERVSSAAKKAGVRQAVMLRLTPGVQAHTHQSISTAHEDVKFGFSIASGSAWAAISEVMSHPELELRGFHTHIGSQIFGTDSFELAATRIIALMATFKDAYSTELPELDLGGGYAIAYLPDEKTVEPHDVLPALSALVKRECKAARLKLPLVSIEPGRNIVGPTTFTLYEVGTVKDVTLEDGGIRKYVSVDGGMSENMRTSLYDAEYFATLADRTSTAPLTQSRVVGKHCETGDIVIRDIKLPADIAPGDLLATPATGAYGRSMASNYNHVPRPPVVAIKDGKARVIVRRENEADLLALDVKE